VTGGCCRGRKWYNPADLESSGCSIHPGRLECAAPRVGQYSQCDSKTLPTNCHDI